MRADESVPISGVALPGSVSVPPFEEEIMLALDVSHIPALTETSALVAHATAPKAQPLSFDYLLKDCWETEPTPDDPTSALRGSSIANKLRNYYQRFANQKIDTSQVKVTLLQTSKNGELQFESFESEGKYHSGFMYFPKPGYLGKDQAIFAAEYAGKRYKVVLNIIVSYIIDERDPICPEPQLIRLKKSVRPSAVGQFDPSQNSTDLASWQKSSDLMNLLADASQTFTGFSDLAGTAVGQTNGGGANVSITLDTNAAGHGWYVDATPWDNTDDYLPTADEGVWQAKAGTAATRVTRNQPALPGISRAPMNAVNCAACNRWVR
jgi:hypothetical protein